MAESSSDIRRLNVPRSVAVEEDVRGFPAVVLLSAKRREVIDSVIDRWRLDDEWWRESPVSRLYYSVMLFSGSRLVLYKDLVAGGWFCGNS